MFDYIQFSNFHTHNADDTLSRLSFDTLRHMKARQCKLQFVKLLYEINFSFDRRKQQ